MEKHDQRIGPRVLAVTGRQIERVDDVVARDRAFEGQIFLVGALVELRVGRAEGNEEQSGNSLALNQQNPFHDAVLAGWNYLNTWRIGRDARDLQRTYRQRRIPDGWIRHQLLI